MLYDPKWEVIWSTKNFAAWLSAQPRKKTYAFTHSDKCAVAQYLAAHGVSKIRVSVDRLQELDWLRIVNHGAGSETFGAAARRARLIVRNDWLTRVAEYIGIVRPSAAEDFDA
jgi:hypothetical protein